MATLLGSAVARSGRGPGPTWDCAQPLARSTMKVYSSAATDFAGSEPLARRTLRDGPAALDGRGADGASNDRMGCALTDSASLTAEFRRLHETGCFVMPNPWDLGSARALAALGFKALATTSAGFAWSIGHPDNTVGLDQTLPHLRALAAGVNLPLNADFQNGYAQAPEEVATNVALAVQTGVAGLSIEDFSGDPARPLLPLTLAVDRIRAARAAIDDSGTGVLLTARSEGFVWGRPDLDDTIRRLIAYAEAGADCLYAPWITSLDDVKAIVHAVSPKPVNLLIHRPFTTVDEAAGLGVRRISIGGMLAKTAWRGFLDAAREIADHGTFSAFDELPDLNALLDPS